MSRLLRMFRKKDCRWPQSLREAPAIFPWSRAAPLSLLAGKKLPAGPGGGSAQPSDRGNPLPAQALRQWPGPNRAGPGCSWAGRTQPRKEAGQDVSGACCVDSTSPRSPAPIPSRRHCPVRSLRIFQAPQGRRWRIPVPAPAARPAPHGTAAAPGTQAAVRPMDAAALFQDEAQQLMFLHTIHPVCLAAQQRWQDTLEPHCCKAAVVERIVELIEELPDNSPPGGVLANSLIAVGNLSTMTPALEPELEKHLLRSALHANFTLGTEKDTTQVQALHKVLPELLDAMLGNLLAESPDINRLHYILEHINFWFMSRVSQKRARAIRSSTALLRSTITLSEFDAVQWQMQPSTEVKNGSERVKLDHLLSCCNQVSRVRERRERTRRWLAAVGSRNS
ncbi:uncharacterized protein LOC120399449 isoform X2 [Mauremys reevesii]|uniref:uncharacterized protein LOC120399449 isoform X2 n=1 Tax=Mauremys reevesii TaxID=260615 RepID=UPI00193FF6CE|nr:uncharacterized protein LOC120399449 isoform X2 [Mauremys reevesii]